MSSSRRPLRRSAFPLILLVAASILAACGQDDEQRARTVTVTRTVAAPPPAPPDDLQPAAAAPNSGEEPAPASRGPQVVVHRSIAGVRLDMSKAQVHATLGKPVSSNTEETELGTWTTLDYGDGLVVSVDATTRKVFMVRTERPGDATDKGVGVGSSRASVEAAYAGVTCDPGSPSVCRLDKGDGTITDFIVEGGKVSAVVVGYLRD